jgi:hypothetical protein
MEEEEDHVEMVLE